MANKVAGKFTWLLRNFPSLKGEKIYSDEFMIGGCKWRLNAFPKGNKTTNYFPMYLAVAYAEYFPFGWRRHASFSFTIVNQNSEELSVLKETIHWFDEKDPVWGFRSGVLNFWYPLPNLRPKMVGFMVNEDVTIVVKVKVLKVIGKLDVAEKSEEVTQPLKKTRMNDDGAVSRNFPKETPADGVDVNRFRVPASQVVTAKNQQLRAACMFSLLGLDETLCKSLAQLSDDDLVEADKVLIRLKQSGFKVGWLERKLEEVKQKKTSSMVTQNYEEELKDLVQKCAHKIVLLEKEKEELKDIKQKCADKEALVEKEKDELKDLKRKVALAKAQLEKKKGKALESVATHQALDDVL